MVWISIVRVSAVMVIAVETLAHDDLVIEGPELYQLTLLSTDVSKMLHTISIHLYVAVCDRLVLTSVGCWQVGLFLVVCIIRKSLRIFKISESELY